MLPKFEKTYPPEIAKMRQFWLDQIEEVKRRYEPSPEPMTAIRACSLPKTAEGYDRYVRAYRAEVEPMVQKLMELEGFAIVNWIVPSVEVARA